VRPASRAAKSPAPARCRRTARGCRTSTSATVRPATHRSSPRRTTSTSGSSGTPPPYRRLPAHRRHHGPQGRPTTPDAPLPRTTLTQAARSVKPPRPPAPGGRPTAPDTPIRRSGPDHGAGAAKPPPAYVSRRAEAFAQGLPRGLGGLLLGLLLAASLAGAQLL